MDRCTSNLVSFKTCLEATESERASLALTRQEREATRAPPHIGGQHRDRRRVVPAKTGAGCGAKARDWPALGGGARKAAGFPANNAKWCICQGEFVHRRRRRRAPQTIAHSLASHRVKVGGRRCLVVSPAPAPRWRHVNYLQSALSYRWNLSFSLVFVQYFFGISDL